MVTKQIVSILLTGFYSTALGRVNAPGRPTAVLRGGRVIEASKEARDWNVREGIPARLARQRCPELDAVECDVECCRSSFERVWSHFAVSTPLVEPLDFHFGFLDVTGCVPRGHCLETWMRALLWHLHFDTGIAAEWGGGRDRWIARLSCGENRFVSPSEEAAFLSDAGLIRLGISSNLCERLERYGILSVGQLLQVPRSFLLAHLGLSAQEILPFLQRDASVRALYPPPSVTEQVAVDGAGEEAILCAIEEVAQKGAAALAESGHACGSIRITLFVRGSEATGDLRLAKGVCGEAEIERRVLEFLRQHGTNDIASIRLQLGDLLPRGKEQITLWQSTTHRPERTQRIENARRDLSRKFGRHAVFSGGEYSRTIPPRFAQLICARRGMYLP